MRPLSMSQGGPELGLVCELAAGFGDISRIGEDRIGYASHD